MNDLALLRAEASDRIENGWLKVLGHVLILVKDSSSQLNINVSVKCSDSQGARLLYALFLESNRRCGRKVGVLQRVDCWLHRRCGGAVVGSPLKQQKRVAQDWVLVDHDG